MFIVVSINYQRSLSRLEYDEIHVSHWYTHFVTVHNITPKLLVTYPIEYQPWWILFDRRICNVLIIYQHISYRLRLWWFNIYIYIYIHYIYTHVCDCSCACDCGCRCCCYCSCCCSCCCYYCYCYFCLVIVITVLLFLLLLLLLVLFLLLSLSLLLVL